VVVVKGAASVVELYEDPGLRTMVDVDIMVPEGAFRPFHEVLVGLGYNLHGSTGYPDVDEFRLRRGRDLAYHRAGSLPLDVHVCLLDRRDPQRLAPDDMWARARPLPGTPGLWALAPSHSVLHSAAHYGKHLDYHAPGLEWGGLATMWKGLYRASVAWWLLAAALMHVPARATAGQKPLARDDTYAVAVNGELDVAPPGVLANDENNPITAILVKDVDHGSLTLNDGWTTLSLGETVTLRVDFNDARAFNISDNKEPHTGGGLSWPDDDWYAINYRDRHEISNIGFQVTDFDGDALGQPIRIALNVLDPTAAQVRLEKAHVEDGRVALEWETASEVGTAGFYVVRRDSAGRATTLGGGMLPGLLHSPQGGSYRVVDSDVKAGETYTCQLVKVEVGGWKRSCGTWRVTVEKPLYGAGGAAAMAKRKETGKTLAYSHTARRKPLRLSRPTCAETLAGRCPCSFLSPPSVLLARLRTTFRLAWRPATPNTDASGSRVGGQIPA